MRTVRSSGRREGVSQHALGRGVYPSMHWAGGVCLGRGCVPQFMLGYTHPFPVDRMTDACENITFDEKVLLICLMHKKSNYQHNNDPDQSFLFSPILIFW